MDSSRTTRIAIACGGTGGHLFPGLAVGEELRLHGCQILLLVSPKDVDQQAVRTIQGLQVATLPALALTRRHLFRSLHGCWKSFLTARTLFQVQPPRAVLGMGGFTSAPAVLAGKVCGAATFVHESNTIPGRANRWLAHFVDQAFVGFPSAATRLHAHDVLTTGTPVRPQFQLANPASCRVALGLDPKRPTLLVMGGSQGAHNLNRLVADSIPALLQLDSSLQFVHLTGEADYQAASAAYAGLACKALVRPFLTEVELAMGAATVAICRAGASSLAELAAMRLPSVLVPYPPAADNHQLYNARALTDAGAALLLEERAATADKLAAMVGPLLRDDILRAAMRQELVRWHSPRAAAQMAERILNVARALGPWSDDLKREAVSNPARPGNHQTAPT